MNAIMNETQIWFCDKCDSHSSDVGVSDTISQKNSRDFLRSPCVWASVLVIQVADSLNTDWRLKTCYSAYL